MTVVHVPTTGISIRELARAARALDLASFRAQYSHAFFLRHGSKTRAAAAVAVAVGAGDEPRADAAEASEEARGAGGESTSDIVIIAMPIKRRPTSEHPCVGIGRLDGCDVAIVDDTVSKLHAYVEERPAGTWLLHDAKSRNGTTVDGKPVAQRDAGPPTVLAFGQVVRFGSVTTTFTDAASVFALVTRRP